MSERLIWDPRPPRFSWDPAIGRDWTATRETTRAARLTIGPSAIPGGGLVFQVLTGQRSPVVFVSDIGIELARNPYGVAAHIRAELHRMGAAITAEQWETILDALRARRQWLEEGRG